MSKWFEQEEADNDIVISSRIRLARNLKKYPFYGLINNEQSKEMISDVVSAIKNDKTSFGDTFSFIELDKISDIDKYSMLENHSISYDIIKKEKPTAVLLKDDESVSVMINEEDHVRIQTIMPGYNIDKAWDLADKIDNLTEESVEYAFDKDFGYLTSCITNLGTGLRASFMIHIPFIEMSGRLRGISQAIAKFGMTLRGIYGEGSKPLGSIYQISYQVTLGKSEDEILEVLKSITNQVVEQERELRDEIIKNNKIGFEDKIYRAYGVLKYSKNMTSEEAINLLSDLRIGYMTGILKEPKPKTNIYNIMMNIQPENLMKIINKKCDEKERDRQRALYISSQL